VRRSGSVEGVRRGPVLRDDGLFIDENRLSPL
jgi:hypothetical protein